LDHYYAESAASDLAGNGLDASITVQIHKLPFSGRRVGFTDRMRWSAVKCQGRSWGAPKSLHSSRIATSR
jgi:hypothetical protein